MLLADFPKSNVSYMASTVGRRPPQEHMGRLWGDHPLWERKASRVGMATAPGSGNVWAGSLPAPPAVL